MKCLRYPLCPKCGQKTAHFDWKRASNYWRVPIATVTAFIALPVGRMGLVCHECGERFVALAS